MSSTFITGNGTWLILAKNGAQIDDENLPKSIRAWLYVDDGFGLPLGLRFGDIGNQSDVAAPA